MYKKESGFRSVVNEWKSSKEYKSASNIVKAAINAVSATQKGFNKASTSLSNKKTSQKKMGGVKPLAKTSANIASKEVKNKKGRGI